MNVGTQAPPPIRINARSEIALRWFALASSLLLLSTAAAIGLAPLWSWLHNAWNSLYGVYSHGYPVAVCSVWMGVHYWRTAPPLTIRVEWWGLVALLGAIGLLWVMQFMHIGASRVLALPPIILATVVLVLGRAAARRLTVPTLFFYFALLPWWLMREGLQSATTAVVEVAVRRSGITAYVEDNYVHIPAGVFEIAESCSGLSFFISGMILATFYGLMYLECWSHRVVLIAIACAGALLSNWIRVYSLILIGHFSEMQHPLVDEHYFYGWLLLLVVLSPVMWLALRLEKRQRRASAHAGGRRGSAHVGLPEVSSPGIILAATILASALLLSPRVVGATDMQTHEVEDRLVQAPFDEE